MKKQENTKQKLFEMVSKLDPTFKLNEEILQGNDKSKLNEDIGIDVEVGDTIMTNIENYSKKIMKN